MAKRVTLIEPTASLPESPTDVSRGREKVAAYARVSTGNEDQATSLVAQTDYYRKKIQGNPAWDFVGIYADDGVSGTSYMRREGFNSMIQDCRDGKITMILTKSISRFARNTVDTIRFIRELKDLGIGVMFEKENIWSLDSKGEFLLTVMSSIAQEESRNISENVTWGHRKRMADGKYSVAFSRFLGYDQGRNGEFVLNEEEAVHIRRIFSLFIQGYSCQAIASIMEETGVASPAGNDNWSQSTVRSIISNEKYKGDALLQKSFTVDFLTKKQKKNEGEFPKYYVKAGHPAIIDPELFDYAQELERQRAESVNRFSGQNPFASKMRCGVCGEYFGPKPWHITDRVWGCRERGRTGHTCANIHIYDYALWYQLKQVLLGQLRKRSDVLSALEEILKDSVEDDERRSKAAQYLSSFCKADPDELEFGEEPAFIFREMVFFPHNKMQITFTDSRKAQFQLRRYAPKKGWITPAPPLAPRRTTIHPAEAETSPEQEPAEVKTEPEPQQRFMPAASGLTVEKKRMIDSLRRQGFGYKRIAGKLYLNANTVKSYCRRHPFEPPVTYQTDADGQSIAIRNCQNCGVEVKQTPGRKPKKFCCDNCRVHWWNAHLSQVNRKAMYEFQCPVCSRGFTAYGNRGRKYCSHECYIRARFYKE